MVIQAGHNARSTVNLKQLVGSGDKIGMVVAPFLVAGATLNVLYPSVFRVGGPPAPLLVISIAALVPGVTIWAWSVVLILTKVPRGELITTGPYALVKHPLYTSVALLVLPSIGFVCNTWLGALAGALLYLASRLFAPEEEMALSKTFGDRWDTYARAVKAPWL